MTLITITLTEEKQELLLSCAGINKAVGPESPYHDAWQSIADDIRRAQDASPWEQPADNRCGTCGIPRRLHPSELVTGHRYNGNKLT